jgi:hypothetical protein
MRDISPLERVSAGSSSRRKNYRFRWAVNGRLPELELYEIAIISIGSVGKRTPRLIGLTKDACDTEVTRG